MYCPVCRTVNLTQSDRSGVTIDYCPQCRGVWLDRGELDKIIERAMGAPMGGKPGYGAPQQQPHGYPPPQPGYGYPPQQHGGYYGSQGYYHYDDDDDDYYKRHGHYPPHHKKKSFLGEVFDFD
jgi:uncharacterized protein